VTGARIAVALLLAGGLACEDPPEGGAGNDGGLPVSGDLALVRVARWPAAGVELTLRVDQDGRAGGDLSGSIRLADADGADVDWTARPVALAPGYTALLVQPAADAAARGEQEQAIAAFLTARPPDERIALYRWGAVVDQVVAFTRDRDRLGRRIAVALAPPLAEEGEPADAEAAALAAAAEAQEIGGTGPRVMRSVVIVGDRAEEAAAAAHGRTPVPILAAWGDRLMEAASAASANIDRLALEAHYTVGVCAGGGAAEATLTVDGVLGELGIAWPTPWPESQSGGCESESIGAGPPALPEVFELLFTDEQRAVYDDRVASLNKDEFDLSIRLAADEEPIAASAHLHGKGTLGCDRKSYTLTLDGPGRRLFADAYADEFFLIAMCADDRYLQLYTSYQLLAAEDLFPLGFRYVELMLDGEEGGVYLLIEKSDDALEQDSSRVSAVLRRRDDAPGDHMEVEKSRGDPAAASGAWNTFEESLTAYAGEELLAAAEDRFDLDGYLVWVALMTALENGDYIDEVLLTATDARSAAGDVPEYWTFTAWDNDDLFTSCHHGGAHAIVDPNELLYCVEADLDRILFADPVVYARYAEVMSEMLDRLTPDRMQEALDATGAALLPYFERPEICQAMTELTDANPGASDPAEAQRDIREHLDLLHDDYESRRVLLETRLDDLEGAAARPQASPRTNWPDHWTPPSSRSSPRRRENQANDLDSHYN
jgi:hypothetical protein